MTKAMATIDATIEQRTNALTDWSSSAANPIREALQAAPAPLTDGGNYEDHSRWFAEYEFWYAGQRRTALAL